MKNKKLVTIAMSILCVAALTIGSLALFTDRFQSEVTVTARTLDLALTQNWATDNANVISKFKPGQGFKLAYTLNNQGTAAARVRETLIFSSDTALTAASEFALYDAKDVTVAADGTATIASGASAITATSTGTYQADGKTWHKYAFETPEFNLDGNTEKVSSGADKVQSKTASYVLVFNLNSSNDFQKVNVKVEYLAQGLQYSGTGENTWKDAKVISDSISFGGADTAVVPVR